MREEPQKKGGNAAQYRSDAVIEASEPISVGFGSYE